TQSFEDVANSFAGSYRVSTYLWDTITTKTVKEYDAGDTKDGYVVGTSHHARTGLLVSYPKFTSRYGTSISLKKGIWDSTTGTYDSTRLKIINVPVLKSHHNYDVSGAVKHYMGVVSEALTIRRGYSSHNTVDEGGMGTEMVETRFPVITIMDAIWVNAYIHGGPSTPYEEATRVNTIAASTDPVALDAWAARSILIPEAQKLGYSDVSSLDPDYRVSGSFGHWLELSMNELRRGGYNATMDRSSMSIQLNSVGWTYER
ncbi:MAG: DUF362 domain-containing protein, partial [Methanomicrobiales archaeon]|nr:DUF362 domain-containing protein [Methanomicrobiales archaeon]MDD1679742.1 DUF362 domain-containing protein [Methanomicrobiales archaeon]